MLRDEACISEIKVRSNQPCSLWFYLFFFLFKCNTEQEQCRPSGKKISFVKNNAVLVPLPWQRATTEIRRHTEVKFHSAGMTVMIISSNGLASFIPKCLFSPSPSHVKWLVVKVSWSPDNEEVALLVKYQWSRRGCVEPHKIRRANYIH